MNGMDVSALRQGFAGQLVVDGDEDFDSLRSVFNGMIDRRPAIIARCESTDDVRAAVKFARERSLPLSVYGGGHAVTGHAVCEGGVCVDLRLMNRATVDPDARVGRVQGGALWRGAAAGGGTSTPQPRNTAWPSLGVGCRTPASVGSPWAVARAGSSESSASPA